VAGLKDIRRRITSVKNTKQITRAMKLVSAAKLRRAQEAALGARAFSAHLREALAPVLLALPEGYTHPLLAGAVGKPRRVVMVSGERGLCGAYNANVAKAVVAGEDTKEGEFICVGKRSSAVARRGGWNVLSGYEGFSEDPALWPINEIADGLLDAFRSGKCSEVTVYYTKFISALSQQVTNEKLLPFVPSEIVEAVKGGADKDIESKFDTDPVVMFEELVPLYIRSKVREATLEAKASEHAARMTAMDSATNNASDLIDRLRLFYNRARQSAITRELIDIVGGAEAVK